MGNVYGSGPPVADRKRPDDTVRKGGSESGLMGYSYSSHSDLHGTV
jgi:hypothetical protein